MAEAQENLVILDASLSDVILWGRLVQHIMWKNRFFPHDDVVAHTDQLVQFLKQNKSCTFKTGKVFHRARLHHFLGERVPFKSRDMGAPPKTKATAGRLNPIGIPYLYVASDRLTAVSELRPWKGSDVSVAEVVLQKDLTVANVSTRAPSGKALPAASHATEFTWRELVSKWFSTPFDPSYEVAYAPTQYIAEAMKKAGLDGVMYDSAMNDTGYNIALFDPGSVKPRRARAVRVSSIVYAVESRPTRKSTRKS
jgi:RES domain-containing protein